MLSMHNDSQTNMKHQTNAKEIFKKILGFLQLLMGQTLSKRLLSMALIAVDVPNSRITELTGLCDKSVRTLRKTLETGEFDDLFHVGGGGSQGKLIGIEKAIIEEIYSRSMAFTTST